MARKNKGDGIYIEVVDIYGNRIDPKTYQLPDEMAKKIAEIIGPRILQSIMEKRNESETEASDQTESTEE